MTTKKDETTMELLVDGKIIASAKAFKVEAKKENKMTNREFLKLASWLQLEFVCLYNASGLVAVDSDKIHVTAKLFHELEKENLLEHISKAFRVPGDKTKARWDHEAMTQGGVKVIAIEDVAEMEKK